MTPSLRGLRVFCAAARYLSFKQAAESLFITASAVSHQIKSLEHEFDTELFIRGPRSLTLTPRGIALYERVDPLLTEINQACASVFARQNGVPVRFAAPPFFATEMLIPRLSETMADSGRFSLELSTMTGKADGHPEDADFAVVLSDHPPEDTQSTILFPLELVPACAPSLAESLVGTPPTNWRAETLIVHRDRANAWRRWFRQQQLRLKHPERVMQLDSMFAVARAAEQGLGIALVPSALSAKWFRSGGLVRLSEEALKTGDSYHLSWRENANEEAGFGELSSRLAALLTD